MKRLLLVAAALMVTAGLVSAETLIPERLLLTTGQYIGPGARPAGLAGTYTGIADDYSSIWWNPAGLTQVKRIEMQGSLSRSGYANETNYFGGKDDGTTSSLRLNNLGIVFPVPVYQGALSFALGYNQLTAFDRRTRVLQPTGGTADWNEFDELEDGRLGMWSLAGAVDVSQNLALGLGVNYISGVDDYTFTGSYSNSGLVSVENTVTTDVSFWSANVGGLLRMGRFARLGAMVQAPINSVSLEEEWTDASSDNNGSSGSDGYFDYRMTTPAVFRVGLSFSPGRWLVAGDVEYRDWTTMEYRTDPPYSGVTRAAANQEIKDTYRSTTRLSLGGEYLFPVYGIRARAGYAFEPSAYELGKDEDNRSIIAFGLSALVDRSVMLDLAYRFTTYTEKFTPGLTEAISASAAMVTISYRM